MQKDQEKSQSWWQTLQGILTATGAVIVAITGLIGALYQAGIIGGKTHETTSGTVQTVPETKSQSGSVSAQQPQSSQHTLPAKTVKASTNENSLPPVTRKPMSESLAIITTDAGARVHVNANTLYVGYNDDLKGLPLSNGLTVNFDKIKFFEVLGVNRTDEFSTYEEGAGWPKVRITLWSEETITGEVTESFLYLPHFFLYGSSDLGDFRIRPWQIQNVRFER